MQPAPTGPETQTDSDPAGLAPAGPGHCPWCSAPLPAGEVAQCPSCGASLLARGSEDVPGLTTMSLPEADEISAEAVADLAAVEADIDTAELLQALAPPTERVRREMHRIELEAASTTEAEAIAEWEIAAEAAAEPEPRTSADEALTAEGAASIAAPSIAVSSKTANAQPESAEPPGGPA